MPKHENARLRRPVILKVDANVLFLRGVEVALGRANLRGTEIYRAARAYYQMDWPVLLGEAGEDDLHYRQRIRQVCDYEILIPDRVPVKYISGIV